MIKNNHFHIPNLTNIVILGYSDLIENIKKFNSALKIKTTFITTSHQVESKKLNIKYNIFNNVDKKLKNYLVKNFDFEKTIFISLGCRYIFKKDTIKNFFKENLVNFHGARLPIDSGAGHWSWKIMRGDRIENQLVHLIDEDIDKGPIIDYSKSIFPSFCKIPSDYNEYTKTTFLKFYKQFITNLKKGKKFKLKHQIDYIGAYYPRLNTNINGWINWDIKSYQVERFVNAFDDPYPGASTLLNKKHVRIKKIHLSSGDISNHPFMAGLISRHDKNWIVVSSADKNMFLIEEVLNNKGKNIISEVKVGDRFFTPDNKINYSRSIRVKYNSKGILKK